MSEDDKAPLVVGVGTILLAEDDEMMRGMATAMFKTIGMNDPAQKVREANREG